MQAQKQLGLPHQKPESNKEPEGRVKVEANYRGTIMVFLSVDRFEILVPTGNEPLSAYYRKSVPSQAKKRQMVGGPSAASSGGMSDVALWNKTILVCSMLPGKITKVW